MASAVFRLRCVLRETWVVYSTAVPSNTRSVATTESVTTSVLPSSVSDLIFMELLLDREPGAIIDLSVEQRRGGDIAAVGGFRIARRKVNPDVFVIRRAGSIQRDVERLGTADVAGDGGDLAPAERGARITLPVKIQLAVLITIRSRSGRHTRINAGGKGQVALRIGNVLPVLDDVHYSIGVIDD